MVNNRLYYGDNLDILRDHIPAESVDLVYLDPPFQSNRAYNVLFAAQDGTRAPAQIQAFDDTWRWDEAAVMAYHSVLSRGGAAADSIHALHFLLGDSDMMAYLAMMAPRLSELRRVLKPTGNIYLHCDPTASHYLKVLMDGIFGATNLRNEIIWQRTPSKALATRRLPRNHDVILSYQVSDEAHWNADFVFQAYDAQNLDSQTADKYTQRDAEGRLYQLTSLLNPNHNRPNLTYEFLGVTRVWRWTRDRMQAAYDAGLVVQPSPGAVPRFKRYLDEQRGRPLTDVWTDIDPLNSRARERLGYPTQKPLSLLERIIKLSSNPGDVVLDPFCGCGTAIDAAQGLGRRWIGIDITHLAINLVTKRLQERYPGLTVPRPFGEPTTIDGAAELAHTDPHGFQDWICALADAQSTRSINGPTLHIAHKKGADRGIDGRLYFHDDHTTATKQIVLSVKAGHLQPAYVRELRGVMEREGAEMAALLTLHEPTPAMKREALAAGLYTSSGWNKSYQRLQIITVADLFASRGIAYPPPAQTNVTHKRAQRARVAGGETLPLPKMLPLASTHTASTPMQPSLYEMPPQEPTRTRKRSPRPPLR